MGFLDRADGGRQLATRLARCRLERPIVLALPGGGVPVAFEVACALGAQLEVLLVRRSDEADADAAALVERQSAELVRRIRACRAGLPPPRLTGRTAVLVDDGVAQSGAAGVAARAARQRGAARVILAAPVVAAPAALELRAEVDAIVAVELPPALGSVGEWYETFEEVSAPEVVAYLCRAPAVPPLGLAQVELRRA